jgi:hypothetical protein
MAQLIADALASPEFLKDSFKENIPTEEVEKLFAESKNRFAEALTPYVEA